MDIRQLLSNDRGEALISYALVVLLISVAGIVALRSVGNDVSDTFGAMAMATDSADADSEMTPDEKWEKAKADRDAAVAEAAKVRDAAIAEARAIRNALVEQNKSLPRAERQAANAAANKARDAAIDAAKAAYKTTVDAANAARDAAKAEWQAAKKKKP
jgi:Flp pilus assembly pilin Flp